MHPWRSSRSTRALAMVACVLASWTCDQETAGPGRRASLAVAVLLPPTDLAAFNLTIDNARLIVVRPPADTVFDKVFSFPANQSSLPVSADVPLEQSPATFQVTIQLLSGATVLFEGTQDVTLTAGETSTPTPIPVSYSGPGQNVATLTLDPADSALSFGGTLTFRPTARDGQGNLVPSFYVSWTTSDTVAAPIDATGTLIAPTVRRTVTVTARTPTNVSASTPITFAPVANGISIVSGCGQSGAPGAQLPQPVVVRVIAADQLGVQGVSVQFTPPAGGAVNPAQAVTDANGLAQTAVTLGPTPGAAQLSISASGLTTQTCGQTVQSVATQLAFTAQPTGSVVAGTALTIVITARDGLGNTATGFTGNVSLAFGSNPGGSALSGTTTVAAVGGVATFAALSLDKVGSGYTLVASSGSLTSATSAAFDVAPAAPARLLFSVQPTSVQLGGPITPAVVVAAQDQFGNPTPSFTGSVALAFGANPGGATLGGTNPRTAVAGLATFSDLALDQTGTGYTLVASSGALTPATSAPFNVVPVSGLHLAFTTLPSNVTAGSVITPPVVVTAQDAQNNVVSSFTAAITISFGSCPIGAALSGTATLNATAGVASFNDLSIDKAGGCTLVASSPTLQNVASNSFTVAPGAPARLAFSVQPPASVAAGAVLTPAVRVEIEDALGNLVGTATNNVTLALGTNPTGAVLGGTLSKAAASGVAVFTDLTVNLAGTGYTLAAASGSLTAATSTTFAVATGAATQLAITSQPSNATAGAAIAPAVTVGARDGQGNLVSTFTGNVTVALLANPGGSLLSGTLTRAAVAGVATFDDLSLNKAANGYTLRATSGVLTAATSVSFTITAGAAAQLAFTAQPTNVLQGVAIAPPVAVAVQDALGNTVPGATNLITVAIGTNPNSGTLSGTLSQSAVAGVAAFGALSIDNPGTGYTLQATATGFGSIASTPFNVLPNGAGVAWINAAGGNWSVASNWSPARVPTKSDTVFITLSGTYTVTLDVNDTVAFLTVGGASGAQTLVASGRTLGIDSAASLLPSAILSLAGSAINGGGTLASGGAITVSPGTSLINATTTITAGGSLTLNGNNGFADLTVAGALSNAGTIDLTGTSWAGRLTAGTLVNTPGGTVQTVAGAGNVLTVMLNNQGAVQVDGPLTLNAASAAHQNSGTIILGAGDLTLSQSGTTPSFTTTGSVVVGAGRVLQVNGGAFNYANAAPGGLAGLGAVNFTGVTLGLTPDVTQDTLTLNLSSTVVNGPGVLGVAPGRTLSLTQSVVNAALVNQGTVQATPGSNAINGPLSNQSGALLRLNGNNGFADVTVASGFTNAGTIELTGTSWAGRLTVGSPSLATLVNAPGATLRALAGAGNVLTAVLNNQGTVQVDGPLTVNGASAAHQSSGTITLGVGDLTLNQSGTTPSFTTTGSLVVGSGRVLQVNGGAFNYANASPGGLAGLGTVNFSGVTLGLTPGFTQDTLTWTLSNTTVNGPGTMSVAMGRTLTLTQSILNTALTNFGTVQGTPGLNALNGALSNQSGALLRLNGNNGFADMTVASGFTNAGTIELTGTSWAGRLTVTSGTLLNAPTGTLQAVAGAGNVLTAVLNNQGAVQVDGPLTLNAASAAHQNSGTITLGAGDLTLNQSGTTPSFTTSNDVVVSAGRTWTVNSGAVSYAAGKIEGNGTLAFNGVTLGLGVSLVHDTLRVALNTVTVNGPGTITVASGATMTLTNTTFNTAFINQGTVQAVPGVNTFNAALTNPAGALLRLNGNNGFADVTVASAFTNGGIIELTGTSWAGRLTVGSPTLATLVNSPGATLRVVGGAGSVLTAQLNNQGTVLVNGPLTLNGPSADHQNSGTITLGSGDLTMSLSGTTPSFTTTGSMIVGPGRALQVNGGAFNYANASPGGLAGLGTVNFSGVTLGLTPDFTQDTLTLSLSSTTVNGPGVLHVAPTRSLTLTQSTLNAALDNAGTVQATPGTNVINGTLTNQVGALFRLNGNNGFADVTVATGFTNDGAIELTGTSWAGRLTVGSPTAATLVNAAGATLQTVAGAGNVLTAVLNNQGTVQVGGPLTMNAAAATHANSGLIKLTGGDLTVALSGFRPALSNTGTIDVGTNKLTVNGTGTFINQSSGVFMGSGIYDVSASGLSFITDGKTIVGGAPGFGVLTFKGYYLMGPTGSVDVEIDGSPNPPVAGSNFDQLQADSVNIQGGTLNATAGSVRLTTYPIISVPAGHSLVAGFQAFTGLAVPKCTTGFNAGGNLYQIVCP